MQLYTSKLRKFDQIQSIKCYLQFSTLITQVGTGPVPGLDVVMEWRYPTAHPIEGVAVSGDGAYFDFPSRAEGQFIDIISLRSNNIVLSSIFLHER